MLADYDGTELVCRASNPWFPGDSLEDKRIISVACTYADWHRFYLIHLVNNIRNGIPSPDLSTGNDDDAVDIETANTFSCRTVPVKEASQKKKKIQLYISFSLTDAPTVTIHLASEELVHSSTIVRSERDNVTLKCRATAKPAVESYAWFKNVISFISFACPRFSFSLQSLWRKLRMMDESAKKREKEKNVDYFKFVIYFFYDYFISFHFYWLFLHCPPPPQPSSYHPHLNQSLTFYFIFFNAMNRQLTLHWYSVNMNDVIDSSLSVRNILCLLHILMSFGINKFI